jgi:hypothetical protein
MNMNFNVPITDEPYTSSTSENKTVAAEYYGAPYIVIGVDPSNSAVMSVDREAEEAMDMSEFEDDVLEFHLIAVNESNVLAVAKLTHQFTSEASEYTESLNDDETYTYPYDANNVFNDVYNNDHLTYDADSGAFTMPGFLTHGVSTEDFWTSITERKEEFKVIQAAGTLNEDQQTAVDAYVDWMENAPTKYDGVAHYKIPFPNSPEV